MNLDEFKEKLIKEREELKLLLETIRREGMETIKEYVSSADELADKYETKQEIHLQEEILKERLKKVEKALAKIEKNNYGICEKCGQVIEKVRLEIDPAAEFCRKCSI